MEQVISVIQAALPVLVALCLGMLCRKTGFLTRDGIDALKKVVLNVTLPAVLLNAFATAEYSLNTLAIPVAGYLACCGLLALGFLIARLCKMQVHVAPFFATGFEAGMLGYALFVLLFPKESTSKFAILDLGQTLFVFTAYKIMLSGKTDWKAIGKDMVTTPILWAVAAGVVLGATGLYGKLGQYAGILDSVTGFVSAPTGMIILLTVGYDLVLKEIPWKKTAGLLVLRLAATACFAGAMVLLNRALLGSIIFEGAILLMAILPPPYVIPIFADNPEERTQVSSALSAMTLFCIVQFALFSIVLQFTR